MSDAEMTEFMRVLHACGEYYGRTLSRDAVAMYWAGLRDLEIGDVRAALNAHIRDAAGGQFMPKVADIRRQVEAARPGDGHPGPDEAWAIAVVARDESASVVWTPQIAAAFLESAMPLLDIGDRVAARRAFIERYERELVEARRTGTSARWSASLGTDVQARAAALEHAVQAQRLTADQAAVLLPAPAPSPGALLQLEHAAAQSTTAPEVARQRLAAIRALVGGRAAA